MSEEMSYGKTMLEVSKELGVSKDVVKYHQRKMDASDSFKVGGDRKNQIRFEKR